MPNTTRHPTPGTPADGPVHCPIDNGPARLLATEIGTRSQAIKPVIVYSRTGAGWPISRSDGHGVRHASARPARSSPTAAPLTEKQCGHCACQPLPVSRHRAPAIVRRTIDRGHHQKAPCEGHQGRRMGGWNAGCDIHLSSSTCIIRAPSLWISTNDGRADTRLAVASTSCQRIRWQISHLKLMIIAHPVYTAETKEHAAQMELTPEFRIL